MVELISVLPLLSRLDSLVFFLMDMSTKFACVNRRSYGDSMSTCCERLGTSFRRAGNISIM